MSKLGKGSDLPKPYNTFEHELSIANGLLLKGIRIVIPRVMRNDMLLRIHEGHLGIEKCRRRARTCMYWPKINDDIEKFVKKCSTCNKFQYAKQKEPLMMREVPKGSWIRVGTDLFQYAGKTYLIVYDAYSNYPEVQLLTEYTSEAVITCLKEIFARNGIPQELLSDGGPQYGSQAIAKFALEYDFRHVLSSPYFPQSNGLSEKGVQVMKRLVRKCIDTDQDLNLALLSYKCTPLLGGKAPCELLMGRMLRDRVPRYCIQGGPEVCEQKQNLKKGKLLKELNPGDVVRVKKAGQWDMKAQVLKLVAPRSYLLQTERGTITRRNRVQLLSTNEQMTEDIVEDSFEPKEKCETKLADKNQAVETKLADTQAVNYTVQLRRSTRIRRVPDRLVL